MAMSEDQIRYMGLAETIEERDPHYLAALGNRKRAVSQLEITVEPGGEDQAALDQASALENWLQRDELSANLGCSSSVKAKSIKGRLGGHFRAVQGFRYVEYTRRHWPLLASRLAAQGMEIALIAEPDDCQPVDAAQALGAPYVIKARWIPVRTADLPWRPDLVVSAHSFRIVPDWFIEWSRLGAIGYHPSLLPVYKGRNAIRDCLEDGQRITGGTVYWLTPQIDGGPVVAVDGRRLQERVQILPGETALQLWKRALAPLGVKTLTDATAYISRR